LFDKKKNQKHDKSIGLYLTTIEDTQEFSTANSALKVQPISKPKCNFFEDVFELVVGWIAKI